MTQRIYKPANWNVEIDNFTQKFWKQFIKQFWVDTEVGIGKDETHWSLMSKEEKRALIEVLAGLTLLDTLQSEEGMPSLKQLVGDSQRKAVLSFMETMEAIHAKSYSTIFTTLLEKFENDEIMLWTHSERHLQYKADKVNQQYQNAKNGKKELYLAMVASVYLESFLFYSGFFFPLYLAGHGRMMATADMINLILRDEAIHGIYIGLLAQELYQELSPEEQGEADAEAEALLLDLIENEIKYSHEVYGRINLASEVIEFVKYNANKALMNLGKSPIYSNVNINPIVEAGLSTETKTFDFFSVKGSGYIKAQYEELVDEDFNW